jgi:hypothetical protein
METAYLHKVLVSGCKTIQHHDSEVQNLNTYVFERWVDRFQLWWCVHLQFYYTSVFIYSTRKNYEILLACHSVTSMHVHESWNFETKPRKIMSLSQFKIAIAALLHMATYKWLLISFFGLEINFNHIMFWCLLCILGFISIVGLFYNVFWFDVSYINVMIWWEE